MKNYNDYIAKELMDKLFNFGYPLNEISANCINSTRPTYCITDNRGDSSMYYVPTYAEIFDWFAIEKSIIISMEPFFTNTIKKHIAYTWKITYIVDDELKVIRENDIWNFDDDYGNTFNLTANEAIKNVLENPIF